MGEAIDMRIADGVLWKARRDPFAVALRMDQEERTYGELAAAVLNCGQAFRELGGQPGDVVALYLHNSIAYLELFLSLAHAGFVVAPLNPRLLTAENEKILEQMNPWRVIREDDQQLIVTRDLAKTFTGIWLKDLCVQKPTESESTLPYEDRTLDAGLSDEDIFYVGYSSGTTGAPKGLLRTHRSWTESFFGMTLEFGISGTSTLLVPGPLYYSASLIAALHVLFVGGTVELLRHFDPDFTAKRIKFADISAVFMVPTMYRSVLDVCRARPEWATDAAITCISAGDKLPVQTRVEWCSTYPHATFYEYFGSSEVGFVSVCPSIDDETYAQSVGLPFFPAQVRVVNGEIQVKSGMGFSGYAKADHDLQKQIERSDGWKASGDLGYIDEKGYLYLTGRSSDLIICGGVNLYPSEIERVALVYPGVREACAFGIPDSVLGQIPVCVVVWEKGIDSGAQEVALRRFLHEQLSGYKRPRQIWSRSELPKNAGGKVMKRKLLEELQRHEKT